MDLKDSTSEGSMGSLEPSSIQMFANTSSLHGIRHIFVYGPVTIRRLLWTMAFVGSLGLLLVESSDRVAFYFSYQHVTKVDEVVANSLVFPAVTICNLNEFRFSRLTTNDLYHAGELLALLDVNLQIPAPHLADPAVLAALQDKANFKQYKPKIFNMQEFLGRVGHDLKDMLLYCKFKGRECSQKDFKTPFVSATSVPCDWSCLVLLAHGCALENGFPGASEWGTMYFMEQFLAVSNLGAPTPFRTSYLAMSRNRRLQAIKRSWD
ncbi:Amiloride-sensitive cation channel 1, neuronal [Chelonia mydas]|uniref:Amiloride-sensitive cation channel 1, neuronal n=1 Tax=Chelonia mydas TaxID=8469 RepID=M7B6U6_CHEMY|nr:Amiloride-sensitive cation channel 1, neuronal [Chelonia mydas]